MLFLKTRDEMISSQWIISAKPNVDRSGWVITYFDGQERQVTTAANRDWQVFFRDFNPDPPPMI